MRPWWRTGGPADTQTTPTRLKPLATSATSPCNYPPDTGSGDRGGGDGGLGAGFGYDSSHHDFGAAAPLTLCMNVGEEGTVALTSSSPQITVAPRCSPRRAAWSRSPSR
ncbi:hypothetical protein [Cellulomonas chengniuliangii]|uniref:Uncharacterized protein n=1 Tax=Cellulomonas chengniuliangii TaxID=2968084 RepID=A0ABY5KYR5_9CELL|nr:hypothetical protein [Cellulomonas chengniuliangii]MCC2307662.1 hypothetical protein [Cellulomonas chengniuliangii]UUI75574.1 hypothetical protein NP064_01200 [Cellulomonas chengniuliangii]